MYANLNKGKLGLYVISCSGDKAIRSEETVFQEETVVTKD